MDRWLYWTVTHEDHVLCNPLSLAHLDEALALAAVPAEGRVLDIACGKGEALVRLAERGPVHGIGIDLNPAEVRAARERARRRVPDADLRFVEQDGAAFTAEPNTFDLTICLGASWVFGGHRGTLAALSRWTRPGGRVLVAQPYWLRAPDPEYLRLADLSASDFSSHEDNIAAGRDLGLVPLLSREASVADWDEYEGLQCRAAERYASARPSDPDAQALLSRARVAWDAFLRFGRSTVGDALYLYGVR